ncbi:DUF58 domain-containing protein [Arachidicoccus ginsenosidimutans]|uniref:DUF58 domain-containing protein n=1 Tax=Arachidicoccus sp. BS20 TaxID=1850526 RepID=UPI000A9BDBD3|nr:DUF58 domain-containing protein [Arachidicoccus sp. BS20]
MFSFRKNKNHSLQEEKTSPLSSRVRELEIKSKRLTNNLFSGEYHSAFKGRGMAFKEVREYEAGDDIRFIDWNTSARMNHTFSKLFEEERELSVYLLVDTSASNFFGTHKQSKKDLIAEICAAIAFSAASNNDKVSVIFFSDKVEKYIPEKKGRDHILRVVRELLTFKPASAQTDISKALRFLNTTAKHKSIVFILSDFVDDKYEQQIGIAAKKHDVIGIQVFDKMDKDLPRVGLMEVRDPETNQIVLLDTNDKFSRLSYAKQFETITSYGKDLFKKCGADLLQIETGEDFVKILQQFFLKRK